MNNQRMRALLAKRRHSFIGYLVAGYPNREESLKLAAACCNKGLDVLEIGFPARDPSLDGEVIRQAQEKVDPLLAADLTYWQALREAVDAPIWLMGYYHDLVAGGACFSLAKAALFDVLVVPDMHNHERVELAAALKPYGVDVMGFIHPQSAEEELAACFNGLPLIYQQLYVGPTGEANDNQDYLPLLSRARATCDAKVFAGFGIATPERATELLRSGFDGVIVGSAIMKQLTYSAEAAQELIERIQDAVRSV